MAWTTPKTNWTRDDVFDVAPDWNRIKGNMEFLQAFARHLFDDIRFADIPDINYTVDCTSNADSIAKTGLPAFPTADVVNTIEDSLQTIMDRTFALAEFRPAEPRYGNGPAWDYADLNRIESMQLRVMDLLQRASVQRTYIPYKLGGGYFAEGLA